MSRSPYKLFDYYTFADRDLFFGREREVMRTVGEVISNRLLVIFATSGSGKSSLINAGVRPALEEEGFLTATIRLDCAPDLAIKRQLRQKQEEKKLPECFAALKDDTDLVAGLRAAYAPKAGQPAPKPLVLFLDQFEEFFIVFRDQPALRRAFIKQVAQIKFDTSLPVYLVLSLRDDYFVHLNEFREEIPSIFHNNANIQLRPLDDAAALRAIVEPARICGLEFEPGLPEQIIRDLKALPSGSAPAPGAADGAPAVGPQERAPNSQEAPVSAEVGREGAPNSSRGGCAPQAPEDGCGVLPITLQIVCYKLWEKRPAKGQPVTRKIYGGDQQDGGLGGAAAIIRRQLDESLQQIPSSEYGLMRKLFRVLMTADLTKRLRSIDDLAEILRLRKREKLTALLKNLTDVSVLRVEHSERLAWYEFRHDYLVKEVAAWLQQFEVRLRRRRQAYTYGFVFGLPLAIVLAGLALWNFLSIEVRFTPKQYEGQEEELYVTRRFAPFGFYVTTGFRRDEVTDYEDRNAVAQGYPLRFARFTDWRPVTNLLSGFNAARLAFISDPQPDSYSCLVAAIPRDFEFLDEVDSSQVAAAALFVRKDSSLLSPLLLCLQSTSPTVRLRGVQVLAQVKNTNAPAMAALLASLKDTDPSIRLCAAAALVQLDQGDASVVAGLLTLLKDSDSDGRQSAENSLVQLGKGGVPVAAGLLALLKDSKTEVRLSATRALVQLGNTNAPVVESLLVLLRDSDKLASLSAEVLLVQLVEGGVPVVEELLPLLKDNDSHVRLSAAMVLLRSGHIDESVVKVTLALLKDSDADVRLRTAEVIVTVGQDSRGVEALLTLLQNSGQEIRQSAAAALGRLGKAGRLGKEGVLAVEGLSALLSASSSEVRLSAAEALVQLGNTNVPVVDALLTLLKENNPIFGSRVRLRAAEALGQLGKADARVAEGLLALLKDSEGLVSRRAAEALGQLGQADAPVVAGLLALLKDSESHVRQHAAEALGQLGKADAPVVDGLLALFKDNHLFVLQSAAAALVQLGKSDAPVVVGLLALLKDSDSSVRQRAAAALVQLGKADALVVDGLLALLKDSDSSVRQSAAEALVQLGKGDAAVAECFLGLLKNGDSGVREHAAAALVRLGKTDAAVVECFLALLKDSDLSVRRRATTTLVRLVRGDTPVVEALVKVAMDNLVPLLTDGDRHARQMAAADLGKLGQIRRDWTDERLLEMLQDNLSGWRKTAGLVLANRTNLTPATYDQVMALRLDSRPWVRLTAWDALLEIQTARDAREQAAKAALKAQSAAPAK